MVSNLLRFLVFLSIAFPALAAEVAGVKLEDKDRVANSELVLNGAGLRKRAFFQVYAIGLYLPYRKTLAAEVVTATGPKRIAIHMLRDVEADQSLDWVPAAGTQVTVEGRAASAPIPGEDFYRALLRIWLGDKPVQDDLKKALLGEKQ